MCCPLVPKTPRRLKFEWLEDRLALAAPVGNFDAINTGFFAAGWAYDPDSPNQAITVEFRIDGTTVTSQTTNVLRTDVNQAFGISGNHGFNWEIAPVDPWLDGTSRTLRVFAIDHQNGTAHQIASSPKTFQNRLPQGFFEGISQDFKVNGWAFDADEPATTVSVRFFIDNVRIDTIPTHVLRTDVNAAYGLTGNHGFSWQIPVSNLDDTAQHTVRVEVRDPAHGSDGYFVVGTMNYRNQAPVVNLEAIETGFIAAGWAYDANVPGTSINVQMRIDGVVVATIAANHSRPDVNQAYGLTGNHGFRWQIPASYLDFHNERTLVVRAVDAAASTITTPSTGIDYVNYAPILNFEAIDAGFVAAGWAFDPNVSSTSINIQFFIDGGTTPVATVAANQSRPDVNQAHNITGNHGFRWQIPTSYLDWDEHTLEVRAVDPASGATVSSRTFENRRPIARLEFLDERTLTGWAFDPDNSAQSISVRLYFNNSSGQLIGTTTANISRPDVNTVHGITGNHGWQFTIPAALVSAAQTYRIQAYAVDSSNSGLEPLEYRNFYGPAGIPALSSLPGAPVSIYLDFDGNTEASWNGFSNVTTPAFDVAGLAGELSDIKSEYILDIYDAVKEDFAPFNVNVTTVNPGNFSNRVGLKVSIGGNGAWYSPTGAGAAQLGSFTNSTPNTVFVFTERLAYNNEGIVVPDRRTIGDAISHQVGIALGLRPQSVYNAQGVLTQTYNPGDSAVAPIMGRPYQARRSTWHRGPTPLSPNSIQDDIAVIASPSVGAGNGITIRQDDHANGTASATVLTPTGGPASFQSVGGIIETASDDDYFKLSYVSVPLGFRAKVLTRLLASNLDPRLELRSSAGTLLHTEGPLTTAHSEVIMDVEDLPSGDYYLVVRGSGSYGSLGQYTLDVSHASNTGDGIDRIELPPPTLPLPTAPNIQIGDYDTDGHVDSLDWLFWRSLFGLEANPIGTGADGNANGFIDAADYVVWRNSSQAQSAVVQSAVVSSAADAVEPAPLAQPVAPAGTPTIAATVKIAADPIEPTHFTAATVVAPPLTVDRTLSVNEPASRDAAFTSLSSPVTNHRATGSPILSNSILPGSNRASSYLLLIDAAIGDLEQSRSAAVDAVDFDDFVGSKRGERAFAIPGESLAVDITDREGTNSRLRIAHGVFARRHR